MINWDKATDEPTMSLDIPSLQDLCINGPIVDLYQSNYQDLPPSSKEDIMALGYPGHENILEKDGVVISYNPKHKGANFVCELLTPQQINGVYLSRKIYNSFYEDLRIESSERATAEDYKEPNYTKGHLAPASNHAYNFKAYTSTYCYSNVLPMFTNVNMIINKMEKEAQKMARQKEKVYIYTGPVFYPNRTPIYIKEGSGVRVPDSFFKVVVHIEKDSSKKFLRGYEVENSSTTMVTDIRFFKEKLENINSKTGLKILCDVDTSEIVDVLHPPRLRFSGR